MDPNPILAYFGNDAAFASVKADQFTVDATWDDAPDEKLRSLSFYIRMERDVHEALSEPDDTVLEKHLTYRALDMLMSLLITKFEQVVDLSSVELEGVEFSVRRDKEGNLMVVEVA